MSSLPNRTPIALSATRRRAPRRVSPPRTDPAVVRRIEKLAGMGWSYANIASDCQVSRATAHKYGAAARPKPDNRVHLNELELASLRDLARHVVRVQCPTCRLPVLSFTFMSATRCTRCAVAIFVPPPPLRR